MISLLLIISITIAVIAFIITHITSERRSYWKGRFDGWKACEDMSIERAKEHNYDMDKFLSDILQ